jgi:predicted nuclease of predicted toxin-antitoxin system
VKFLADMPISPKTVAFLRSLGHEALRASERGLDRAKDESIVEFARANGMVILTMDLDFTAILARTQAQGPSTILFRLRNPTVEQVNRRLQELLPQAESQLQAGAIVIVEEERMRMRQLPIRYST